MYTVLTYLTRAILVFFFTYLSTRIMTKKAIAEMTAYEMAGLMVLANVAAEPLVDKVVIKSVFGVGCLVVLMMITAKLVLINKLTPILEHTATIIIENGQINMKALRQLNLSMNEFTALLRQQGYDNVSDVQNAIFEPQGTLSVFPKAENKPVTLKDLRIKAASKPITLPLIFDGEILKSNMQHAGISEDTLMKELNEQGIKDFKKEVALAELDPSWRVLVIKK